MKRMWTAPLVIFSGSIILLSAIFPPAEIKLHRVWDGALFFAMVLLFYYWTHWLVQPGHEAYRDREFAKHFGRMILTTERDTVTKYRDLAVQFSPAGLRETLELDVENASARLAAWEADIRKEEPPDERIDTAAYFNRKS